jgi:hypothetical protein
MGMIFRGREQQAAEHEPLPARRRTGERRDPASRESLVRRVVSEFREMPCLRLTPAQAERLFGLRADVCRRVLGGLIADGMLRIDEEGRYATVE